MTEKNPITDSATPYGYKGLSSSVNISEDHIAVLRQARDSNENTPPVRAAKRMLIAFAMLALYVSVSLLFRNTDGSTPKPFYLERVGITGIIFSGLIVYGYVFHGPHKPIYLIRSFYGIVFGKKAKVAESIVYCSVKNDFDEARSNLEKHFTWFRKTKTSAETFVQYWGLVKECVGPFHRITFNKIQIVDIEDGISVAMFSLFLSEKPKFTGKPEGKEFQLAKFLVRRGKEWRLFSGEWLSEDEAKLSMPHHKGA